MSDPRNFAKIDLGYFDNPKVGDFMDDRPRVPLLHLRAILYCRQHLTDGAFPIRAVVRLACATYCGEQCDGQCDFCAAVNAGLFETVNGRMAAVHDYLEHQDSAVQAARRKDAGRKAAAVRWGATKDAKGNADGNAHGNAKANAEREEREERENSAATGAEFDLFWAKYPRKVGKGQAAKAWRVAVKKADADAIVAGLNSHLPAWATTDPKFIPHAATWLNGERWADEIHQPRPASSDGWWN